MDKFITKEESWELSKYEEAYIAIMGDQNKHKHSLERIIVDYVKEKNLCEDATYAIYVDGGIKSVIEAESYLQFVRILMFKTEIPIPYVTFAMLVMNEMYSKRELGKHRSDYTLWINFLVGWYFNRVVQWEVDNESAGATK